MCNVYGSGGQAFDKVKLPLQSYVDAVYEFVGCTMERAGDLLLAKGISNETSRIRFP
jgi:hypothetical protein